MAIIAIGMEALIFPVRVTVVEHRGLPAFFVCKFIIGYIFINYKLFHKDSNKIASLIIQGDKNMTKIKAGDGADIHVKFFGANLIKGVVIVCHGFGEHSGCYNELAEHLARSGYASVVFDQRGHGDLPEEFSANPKKFYGIIPVYDSFLDDIGDILAWVKQKLPDVPVSLYGHSMGGNIALNYLLKRGQSDFACAVIESPWLGLYKEVSPFTSVMAKVIGYITPNISVLSSLPPEDITSHKPKAKEIADDPNYHNRISLRMFSGIKDACAYAVKNAAALTLPTYLAIAENDRIVCNEAIRQFTDKCEPNVKIKKYESHHSIHNDIHGAKFYQDFVSFLNAYEKT